MYAIRSYYEEDDAHEIARLKHLLHQCQDKLDEETHK